MSITRDLSTTFGTISSYKGSDKTFVSEFEIDFSLSGYSLAQNEVMKICTIPAGVGITNAMVYVSTGQSSITDVDIGYGTTTAVANIFDGINLVTGSTWIAANNLTVTNGASYLTTAGALLLTNKVATTMNTAKIKVVVTFVNFSAAST